MILLYVEKTESHYSVKINEYDVMEHQAPHGFGANIKCIYSYDRYEILNEVIERIRDKNKGELKSPDLAHLNGLLDVAYVETLFEHRRRELSRKFEAQKKNKSWHF